MPLSMESQVEVIPGYRLLERLGAGGFGEVWKAEAPGGLLKAVKIVHGSLSGSKLDETRLNQELKALHRVKTIRHPYILSLERFDIVDGRLIIVSELADRTLFDRFKECRSHGHSGVPREELLSYMGETAEALDLMNEQFNLQHLDIKPQNIFLVFNHVKVGDFGLVKDLQGMFAAITSGVTAVYAAPETFDGLVTRYCDQYNLAIAYQEMLTGELPFKGTTGRQLMMQHMTAAPDLSSLPSADQAVVARALAKKPEERFVRCSDFVLALRRAAISTDILENRTQAPRGAAETARDEPAPRQTPIELDAQSTSVIRPTSRAKKATDLPILLADDPVLATLGRTPSAENRSAQPADPLDYVPPPPPERPDSTGDGVLLPALVIGLGGLGTDVLQEFRKSLHSRGSGESWPHIRLLSIDTDAAGYERATRQPDSVLTPEEILVTPFQRLAHYVKRPHEREELQRWLPLNQLTSVARGQTTAEGWRALGRLAYISAGLALPARLRQELEACTDEKTLQDTARRTTLGLRTTRPCVYVVTSLTGGTGSGMFLDLAAMIRRELRQMGLPRAELVALLLAPVVNRSADSRGVANSYAALRELKHFSDHEKASGTVGPFDRCVLLPLPAQADGATACQEMTTLAGDFLCRELITPLGRVADEGRKALKIAGAGMTCHTFGAYWFSVPRRPLLHRVSQHICDRVVSGWGIGDSNARNAGIKSWVIGQLARAKLDSDSLTSRLQETCGRVLGQAPKAWFEAILERWAKGAPGDLANGAHAVRIAMAEVEQLLGTAQSEPELESKSAVMVAMSEARRAVVEMANGQVAEMALDALSEPHFRLACIEQAAQEQLGVALDESARWHRRRSEELRTQAYDLWQRIPSFVRELHAGGLFRGKSKARAADAIRELLGQYVRARWDSVLAQSASRLLQDMQAHLHRYRRGVDCCHKRIGQFLSTFTSPDAGASRVDLGLGRYLLPFGCQTLEEAVTRILDSLPPEEEGALHHDVWNLIRSTLKDHVHVCTAPASLIRDLRDRIDRAVEKLAEDSLGRAHAAEMYLERQAEHADADADLAGAFDEAQPELANGNRPSSCKFNILAVPHGPEGERFRALVKHALPDEPMRSAVSTDDIVFYREQSFQSLDELPQMGSAAKEQYQHAQTTAQFGPHSRIDIAW